jgi:hypothetical protein
MLLAVLAAACSATPTPAPLPVASAPVAAASSSAPVAAPPLAPPPAAAPEVPSRFFPVVVHGRQGLAFFPLATGGVAVDDAIPNISEGTTSTPMWIDARGARWEPHLFDGLETSFRERWRAFLKHVPGALDADAAADVEAPFFVRNMSGDWPRTATLSIEWVWNRTGVGADYTWNGASWLPVRQWASGGCECCGNYEAVWRGQKVSYETCSRAFEGKGPQPIITPAGAECGDHRIPRFYALKALPNGDLLALGRLCARADKAGARAVERWRAGSARSVIEELPNGGAGDEYDTRGLYVAGANDVYVFGAAYAAHHDGKAWTDVTSSFSAEVVEMWTAKDGALWAQLKNGFARRSGAAWETASPPGSHGEVAWHAVAPDGGLWASLADGLWHRATSGAWEAAPLPRGVGGAERVSFTGTGAMVVLASDENGRRTLLLDVKPETVIDLEQAAPPRGSGAPRPRAVPATAGCTSPYVVLYQLGRTAPRDYDFPLTRAALKGHTELAGLRFAETEDAGQRYLVAVPASVDQGARLIAVLRAELRDARPQLLCGSPPSARRTFTIDPATGALQK